jgi:hypothetical protein
MEKSVKCNFGAFCEKKKQFVQKVFQKTRREKAAKRRLSNFSLFFA